MPNAEKEKHLKILHHRLKVDSNKDWKTEHRCLHIVNGKDSSKRCNILYDNATKLKEHRLKEKHTTTAKRKNAKSSAPTISKEPKQLRLDSMLDKPTENITKDNVNAEAADRSGRDDVEVQIIDVHVMATEDNVNTEAADGSGRDDVEVQIIDVHVMATENNVNTEAADGSGRDKNATTSEEKSLDDENRNFESIDATEVTVAGGGGGG